MICLIIFGQLVNVSFMIDGLMEMCENEDKRDTENIGIHRDACLQYRSWHEENNRDAGV